MALSLNNFTSSFAKWGYHTVAIVLQCLVAVREFCETRFDPKVLGSVKDAKELARVADMCKDRKFWAWVACMHGAAVREDGSLSHVDDGLRLPRRG